MPITALPTPPSQTDAANFSARADAFLGALPSFGTEANALAVEVNGYATNAAASAATAVNAPGTSATSTTSLAIGTGSKSLTVQTGKAFVVGQWVTITSTATPIRIGRTTLITVRRRGICHEIAFELGAPEREDAAVTTKLPISAANRWGDSRNHRRVQRMPAHAAVELGTTEREDSAIAAEQPVAATVGGRGHGDDWGV